MFAVTCIYFDLALQCVVTREMLSFLFSSVCWQNFRDFFFLYTISVLGCYKCNFAVLSAQATMIKHNNVSLYVSYRSLLYKVKWATPTGYAGHILIAILIKNRRRRNMERVQSTWVGAEASRWMPQLWWFLSEMESILTTNEDNKTSQPVTLYWSAPKWLFAKWPFSGSPQCNHVQCFWPSAGLTGENKSDFFFFHCDKLWWASSIHTSTGGKSVPSWFSKLY